ncbi:MAG: decarboxylase [Candidatus Margulisiibacteriota bacterium]
MNGPAKVVEILSGTGQPEKLSIAGYPLEYWTEKFELPVHIYYAPVIRANLRAFKAVFAQYYPKGRVCFAAKACTHQSTLKIVKEEGCGCDVASYNETRCAFEAGVAPEMLDLNGNCKEDFYIEDAIRRGMNIVADNIEEFEIVAQIASRLQKRPKVLLRVSGFELDGVTDDSVFTAGTWTKFGAQIQHVPAFIKTLDQYPQIEFMGFHAHIGSQIAQLAPFQAVLGKFIELGQQLNKALAGRGGKCQILNIGGGFPVRYVEKEVWSNIVKRIHDGYLQAQKGDMSQVFVWHDGLAGFAGEGDTRIHLDRWTGERFYTEYPKESMLAALLKSEIVVNGKSVNSVRALKDLGEPMLTIEPGRSVAEDAGVTLAKVGLVRCVAGQHNLMALEMGVTNHGESLIEKPVKKWEIANAYHKKDVELFECFVAGNLCFSGDMLSKYKVFLQRRPVRGDVILIHNTGAYTSSLLTACSNSFPRPARVLVGDGGEITFIKKRDRYEEIFN